MKGHLCLTLLVHVTLLVSGAILDKSVIRASQRHSDYRDLKQKIRSRFGDEDCPRKNDDLVSVAFERLGCRRVPSITFSILPEPSSSGGFGDRLKGMVTTFYQALLTNSSFAVDWKRPYDLAAFFPLSRCSPRADAGTPLRHVIDTKEWWYFLNGTYKNDVEESIRIATNSDHWLHIVNDSDFYDRASSLGLISESHAELFKIAADVLLGCPSPILKKAYRDLMISFLDSERFPKKRRMRYENFAYVGVQLRLGGKHVAGWNDPPRHSMEDISCFVAETIRLCRRNGVANVFLTSDSKTGADIFKKMIVKNWKGQSPFKLVEARGSIVHTDRSVNEGDGAWNKSILDWWTLKHAVALVVSRSGFGETAAWSSNAVTARALRLASPGKRKCDFVDVREDSLPWEKT